MQLTTFRITSHHHHHYQILKPKPYFNPQNPNFTTTHIPITLKIQNPQTQNPKTYTHLLNLTLQQCKKIPSRQLFDEMSQRLNFSLKTAKTIHAHTLKLGVSSRGSLGNSIVDLYAKCGHLDYAKRVFLNLDERDEKAWNSIMSIGSRKGLYKDVLEGFVSMWGGGVVGNQFSYAGVLSACGKSRDVELGKQVHCVVVKTGFEDDAYCQGSLIDMYAKCGYLVDAKRVFGCAVEPDRVSWTGMISGFAQAGLIDEAMGVFEEMRKSGHVLDNVVFGTVLNACVQQGRIEDACRVFSQMPNPNVVAWNVMISGHEKDGNEEEAVKLFRDMIRAGVEPTRSTLGSVFRAIATLTNHECGLQVHCCAVKRGLDSNVYAGSSLVNMYAKCQKMEAARAVFDGLEERNDVLWNTLLGGYSQNGKAYEVLGLYENMKMSGFRPDEYTYTSMLSACACLENLDMGRRLHSVIVKNQFGLNLFLQNALVDMYAKCGSLPRARKLFEQIRNRDNVSWNAIIVGYVQEEDEEEAFNMFRRMFSEGSAPDEVSLASLLSATAKMQDHCKGRQLHCLMVKYGLERSLYAGSSLIDMYCKSGIVEAATQVFSHMPERSVVCMNALISGHAKLSLGDGVKIVKYMLSDGLRPSEVTFASLLEPFSTKDDLYFGKQIHCFILKLGLPFSDEYLAVSLLGMYMSARANGDAISLFSELPTPKSTIMWTVLISGSIEHDNFEEGLLWYKEMRNHDLMPDQATFASVLKACSSLASLEDGRKIHSLIFLIGYDKDESTGSVLVDMYAKCGDMKSSTQVFEEMISKKDVISWNSMIVGYAKNGYAESALRIFDEMKRASVKPDKVTFLGVLTACSHAGLVSEGREIYDDMIGVYGVHPRVDHCACMIDLYGRWGSLAEAEKFIESLSFEPDSMIWGAYLSACRLHGDDVRGQLAAEKLIELEPKSSSPYVLLSHIHAASGNWDDVKSVRKKMIDKGVKKFTGSSKIPWM